jgi:hypothetical protein
VGDVINLNRWRKEARRKAEAAAADASAVRHGRTKDDIQRQAEAERQGAERHEAHRLETEPQGAEADDAGDAGEPESEPGDDDVER